ncbi:hypothetical protein HU200_058283 [Digitaria exilis]|uniref:Uncharacterized protein n=1 Tax=Digitaria exilis TaxID=1010633 RepID=A0A835ADW3_9POAL|nr:hypothetical protein HU200_058283 [Digitaria exilis]
MPGCIRSKTAPLENEEQLGIMFDATNCTNEGPVAPGVDGQGYPTTANEYGTAEGDTLDKDGNVTPNLLPLVDRREKRRKIAEVTPSKNKKTFKDQLTKRLVDANEKKAQRSTNSATSWSVDHVRQEIAQLLEVVIQDGAEEGTDEHYYATQLLMEKKYRDMFLTLRTPNGRLKWLRRAWDDRNKH